MVASIFIVFSSLLYLRALALIHMVLEGYLLKAEPIDIVKITARAVVKLNHVGHRQRMTDKPFGIFRLNWIFFPLTQNIKLFILITS